MNKLNLSLTNRQLIAVTLVLSAFLGISAFSLFNAFAGSAETAQKQRLLNYVYTLLTAAEISHDGKLHMQESLAEPKFSIPNSGLYAQITSGNKIVWQSPSAIGLFLALPYHPGPSEQLYSQVNLDNGMKLQNLAFGIVWENDDGEHFDYTINVSEDQHMLEAQIDEFQLNLWYWLGGTGLMLLIAQWLILRWSLQPLHKAAADLHAIEAGKQQRLGDDYPSELQQLTRNINNLLDHEQSRRQRYKNSLADLAHSLKTPLALLRSELESCDDVTACKLTGEEQLERINALVDYQLQRAATEGKSNLLAPVSIGEIITKLMNSLKKVYQSKNIHTQCEIERDAMLHADEGDMYELLGNLLENAFKYCDKQVNIVLRQQNRRIIVRIEDDGPGVPAHASADIIKRGRRIDTQIEGQGLGLAIASDIVEAYQGKISVQQSYLGGACFLIELIDH